MNPVGHNATHSTWNKSTLQWDYWRAMGGALQSGVIATRPNLPRRELGIAPEDAARSLPATAKRVGMGRYPRGLVARNGLSGDLSSLEQGGIVTFAVLMAAVYLYATRER